jgi:hypothetical protein
MMRQEGKKVRILSQLREIGLPVGDANRMLFLKQYGDAANISTIS